VLIIVIWVCLGLVALALYFANSMSSELRAADNRVAQSEAQQAVAAGTRYAAYQLSQYAIAGAVPRVEEIRAEALPVGEATFWFIGRDPDQVPDTEPVFGLVDEASKLNLNTASRAMLEALPGMTPELAEAILAWKRRSGDAEGGDAGSTYSTLTPPRMNKGAPFETTDELRLVYGATLDVLFAEDANRNGALDANENDGEQSAPRDDQDGQLFAGISEYVTVFSRQPTRSSDGRRRINIAAPRQALEARNAALRSLLQRRFDAGRASEIFNRVDDREFTSVAEFMWDSGMTAEEYERIRTDVTHSDRTLVGLINVNTASEAVLACIPGIGVENAATMVAYRLAHPDALTSFVWLREVLTRADVSRAGRYITDQSYQFTADVAAVGRFGRGYARTRSVFDLSSGTPRIIYHQDLASYGWALGSAVRQQLKTGRDSRT
jgi:DNA uptake protein ComE-like DNA-binding protein